MNVLFLKTSRLLVKPLAQAKNKNTSGSLPVYLFMINAFEFAKKFIASLILKFVSGTHIC